MTLDIFGDVERKKPTMLHQKFLMLRDWEQLGEQRSILEEWTDGFIDRDGKIVDDFQKQFHPSFWEFYLYAVFKELGFDIDMTKDIPDFVVTNPYRINIEAVVPEIREKGRDESSRSVEETLGGFSPFTKEPLFQSMLDEAIERHSSAFCKKANKYFETYKNREWVNDEIPYVIALASFDQVNYGREFYYPMMALLYGWYYNQETDGFIRKEHSTKLTTGTQIDTALFERDEYKHVSAVIYSCTLTLGKLTSLSHSKADSFEWLNRVINVRHDTEFPNYKVQFVTPETPELLTDGLFIFYNPNANVKLPQGLFAGSNIVEIEVDKMMKIQSENLPLVARVNAANVFLPQNDLEILEIINRNYNFDAALNSIDSMEYDPSILSVIKGTRDFIIERNFMGGAHLLSAIQYILLAEKGINSTVRIGEVKIDNLVFDHSWLELDGKVIDIAIMNTLVDDIKLSPIVFSKEIETGLPMRYLYGVSNKLDFQTRAILNMSLGQYLLSGAENGALEILRVLSEKSNVDIGNIVETVSRYNDTYRVLAVTDKG